MFQDKIKANGYEYVENTEILAMEAFKDKAKPFKPIAYPENFDKEDKICIYATPNNFTGMSKGGAMKVAKAFKNNDIIFSTVNLTIGFVNFESKSSKIGVDAKVKTDAQLSVGGYIPCQAGFMDNSYVSMISFGAYSKYGAGPIFGHKKPINSENEIGTLEVASEGETNGYLAGYGISSKYKGYYYKVDQEKYKTEILSLIGKAYDLYFEGLKEQINK